MDVPADAKGQVEVIYAIVPKDALASAVKSPEAALEEEAKFVGTDGRLRPVTRFSAVVFITNRSRLSPLYGKLRVTIPGAGPSEIDVFSISDREPSVFVIDGGGLTDLYRRESKHSEWVTLKVRL